jgi:hypothetical protein
MRQLQGGQRLALAGLVAQGQARQARPGQQLQLLPGQQPRLVAGQGRLAA